MHSRRHFVSCAAALLCAARPPAQAAALASALGDGWPAWDVFKTRFIQADGRVIDFAASGQSTSEGQAYTLFFALVADDRPTFDRVLAWTRTNLAGGDLTARLMAWKWGQRPDSTWGVIDANAASDADLWLSYILFQAGRLWHDDALRATAALIQERLVKELIVQVPGVGPVLLPGPQGFALEGGGWKLNPSYLPLAVLHGMAQEAPNGPWRALLKNTLVMLESVTPQRLAPDWIVVRADGGFRLDPKVGQTGGYDAIRVYLWAGLMPSNDPDRSRVLARLKGMQGLVERQLVPPEKVDVTSGRGEGTGPAGFSAALLPFLDAIGAKTAVEQQRARITAMGGIPGVYYEQALALFALGWMDKRYRFEGNGRLVVQRMATFKK
jgi:endoglucanase